MDKERQIYRYINKELWCTIPGYKGYYANQKGDILGKRGRKLTKRINKYGYETVSVIRTGQKKNVIATVHRLVASAFIYNPSPLKNNQIDHINGKKNDNRVENLEWVSNKENQRRVVKLGLVNHSRGANHHTSKLTEGEVEKIFLSYKTHSELAKEHNVSVSNISSIRFGKTWTEVTKNLDNSNQLLYLSDGIRTLTIKEIKNIYVEHGYYKDIAKRYNTSSEIVRKIKNDELCSIITKDLTPFKRGLNKQEVQYIYTANKTYEELSKEFGKDRGYIEDIKNGNMYRDITKELSRGVKYKNKRVTKEQVVYIYTCSKTVKQLKKELNIKETTIYAIRSQQNHYKTTKNLVKGDW